MKGPTGGKLPEPVLRHTIPREKAGGREPGQGRELERGGIKKGRMRKINNNHNDNYNAPKNKRDGGSDRPNHE